MARGLTSLLLLLAGGFVSCAGDEFTGSGSSGGRANGGAAGSAAGGSGAIAGSAPAGGFTASAGSDSGAGGGGDEPGSAGEAGGGPVEPTPFTISIEGDEDDAVFVGRDERISGIQVGYGSAGAGQMLRIGLRFQLPFARGSRVERATLLLFRSQGEAGRDETMCVQVYESSSVAPFDDAHQHTPEGHEVGGLWQECVKGFRVGRPGEIVESPDLSVLVQRVIDRDDYVAGGKIGFVLSPDEMSKTAIFFDSWEADAGDWRKAELRGVVAPPRR